MSDDYIYVINVYETESFAPVRSLISCEKFSEDDLKLLADQFCIFYDKEYGSYEAIAVIEWHKDHVSSKQTVISRCTDFDFQGRLWEEA